LAALAAKLFPTSMIGNYVDGFLIIAENLGLIMMLVNGTFMHTRYFQIAKALVCVIVLGALFKILHYAGADQLLLFPFPILWLLYVIHFISKKTKNFLDILKVIMLLAVLLPQPLVILHMISYETKIVLFIISDILFWITFTYFIVSGYNRKILFKE
jgi:hypothetical protein